MNIMNLSEKIPSYFYIFLEYGNNMFDQVMLNNRNLRNGSIMSSGINNYICMMDQPMRKNAYITGNMKYLLDDDNDSDMVSINQSVFLLKEMQNEREMAVERKLEMYRKKYYKAFPSRLSGTFAFGSYNECKIVSDKYRHKTGWDLASVKKYKLSDSGVNCFANVVKVVKVNMEIVSFLRSINLDDFSHDELDDLCHAYWNNKVPTSLEAVRKRNIGVISEYIIEGNLEEA